MGNEEQQLGLDFEVELRQPKYLEWLSRKDADLARFFTEDAPEIGALDNPWSAEGLKLAGEVARSTFGETAALRRPEHLSAVDRFARYIGEVYVRCFEGEWRSVTPFASSDPDMSPQIVRQYTMLYLEPRQQLRMAIAKSSDIPPLLRRRGDRSLSPQGSLVWVFENSKNSHDDWVAAGRPSFEEWEKIKMAQILEQGEKRDEEWLAAQPAELETFLNEDVPEIGALDDPWSPEGLRLAEEAARVRFGGRRALLRLTKEANLQLADALHHRTELVLSDDIAADIAAADRFFRYIGEVYVRNGAEWGMCMHSSKRGGGWPVIDDHSRESLDPYAQLLLACRSKPREDRMPIGELACEFIRRMTNKFFQK